MMVQQIVKVVSCWVVIVFIFAPGLAHPQCVMTGDFLAGDSEDNMSKIYSLIREKDFDTLKLMLLSGQARVLKKGTKIYRADGGWFSSTITVGASPKKWIVSNQHFECADPAAATRR